MLRYAFAILIAIHGLLHLMGFVSAFYTTNTSMQVLGISKPIGSFWLIVFLMFLITGVLFLTHKNWFYLAILAVLLSQILIIMAWQDAKFGTIANLIILIVAMSAYSMYNFHKMVKSESQEVLQNKIFQNCSIVTESDIAYLPQSVKTWMISSGVIGKPKAQNVALKQVGTMRTKPNSKWMPFEASQVFNVHDPAFVWQTKVDAMPLVAMVGRDRLKDGKGKMLIKLAGLIPIVNTSDNQKINSGAMLRYLAEICWFPSAALNDYIQWEYIDSNSAKAIFTYKNSTVSGIFSFNDKGDFTAFEADRYYGGSENSQLEKWVIAVEDYKVFHDIKVPSQCKVIWKLKEGDFNWLNLEITEVNYNATEIFKD